jgi:hypothetical protein
VTIPIIATATFSAVDLESLRADVTAGGRPVPFGTELREDRRHHALSAVVTLSARGGAGVRTSIRYRTQVWASAIDDAAARGIAWPRDWPDEVADGLSPQPGVESDDPIFSETVERVSAGRLRLVPPYVAAKELIRYCLANFEWEYEPIPEAERRFRDRDAPWPGGEGRRVTRHRGALHAARTGKGSAADLVSLCVAMLKAAGIPARPVVGIIDEEREAGPVVRWGELFLPGCGWLPFDPEEMKDNAVVNRDIGDAWPGFGTLRTLNRRVPLCYEAQGFLDQPKGQPALDYRLRFIGSGANEPAPTRRPVPPSLRP